MGAAADLAKRHYERFCGDGRASVAVPEWSDGDGAPLVVYWKPFTLRDHGAIFGAEPADAKAWVKVVARKAEGHDGKKLFPDQEDYHVLLTQADHTVVRRIADEIMRSPSIVEMTERLQRDGLRMAMHRLADRLGKTVAEIETMSVAEFNETMVFHRLEAQRT